MIPLSVGVAVCLILQEPGADDHSCSSFRMAVQDHDLLRFLRMCPFPSLVTHLLLQVTPQPGIAVMCIWPLRELWDPSWALPGSSRQKPPTYMSVASWSPEMAFSPERMTRQALGLIDMPANTGENT